MQVGKCKKQQQMTQNQDQQFGQFFSEATSSVFLDLLISWNRSRQPRAVRALKELVRVKKLDAIFLCETFG